MLLVMLGFYRSNFIEIIFWHGCSPVNLLDIFRTPFLKNTSGWLLLVLNDEEMLAEVRDTVLLSKKCSTCR